MTECRAWYPHTIAHMTTPRVRIAPSPTGPLHIGTRSKPRSSTTLFARHAGGTFISAWEDTDVVRSTPEFEADILEHLHWLGLEWDEGPAAGGLPERGAFGPYRQMERRELYRAARRASCSRRTALTPATAPRTSWTLSGGGWKRRSCPALQRPVRRAD